jgi:hypothetical protein
VLKFRSVKSIVSPAANTGNENISKKPVTSIDQINNEISYHRLIKDLLLKENTVVLKFKEPRIELNPATCNEKIAKSTPTPS